MIPRKTHYGGPPKREEKHFKARDVGNWLTKLLRDRASAETHSAWTIQQPTST
jgi:hypothetical protein